MFALLSASQGFAPMARTAVLRGAPALALRGGRSLSMSAEDDIKSIITAMAKDQNALGEDPTRAEADAFMAKYYTPNCITIRPSGNPLSADGFAEMISMDEVKASLHELVDITDVKIFAGGNGATRNSAQFLRNSLTPHPLSTAAVATYTTHTVFTYKGTPNDDIAVFTGVFEKGADGWKVIHGHRATGQPPQ